MWDCVLKKTKCWAKNKLKSKLYYFVSSHILRDSSFTVGREGVGLPRSEPANVLVVKVFTLQFKAA